MLSNHSWLLEIRCPLLARSGLGRWGGILLLALAVMAAGCGEEAPQVRLDVEPSLELPENLAFRQPIQIGYRWIPGPDFQPPQDDYKVFLHVTDPDGNIIEQDDHYPPVPTSQWRSGEPVEYSHWLYPTDEAEVSYIDVHVGLYDGETMGKVGVRYEGSWSERPRVHRIEIREDDNRGIPVYVEGFHEMEIDPERSGFNKWVWMERRGVVAFGNPQGQALLHLQAHSPVDETGGEPQHIQLSIDGEEFTTLTVEDSTPFLERIDVPAEILGDDDWVELTLEVDRHFVPAHRDPDSSDTRELGLQIFGLYLAPRR